MESSHNSMRGRIRSHPNHLLAKGTASHLFSRLASLDVVQLHWNDLNGLVSNSSCFNWSLKGIVDMYRLPALFEQIVPLPWCANAVRYNLWRMSESFGNLSNFVIALDCIFPKRGCKIQDCLVKQKRVSGDQVCY